MTAKSNLYRHRFPPERCVAKTGQGKVRTDLPTLRTTLLKDRLLEENKEKCLDTRIVSDSITDSQKSQQLVVKVPCVQPYERVVTSRPVTFTCQQCNKSVTQERMPGPMPSYCSARCRLDAAAARKRASRATTGKNQGKRGRPTKN